MTSPHLHFKTTLPEISPQHPVVGKLSRYRESGFWEFSTDRMMGLTRVLGDRVEVLVVVALEPGKGHFTEFLEDLRGSYREVIFWAMMNDRLERSLLRQGFHGVAMIDDDGRILTGLVWRRE